MKQYFMLLMLTVPVVLFAQTAKLNIVVSNVKPGKGNVVLNIYNKKENFFKTAFITKTVKADQSVLTFTSEVPDGTYSIAVYQDLDSNGELKYGIFHIPKEPVGFGNNYKPKMSAPSFDDCAVLVKGKEAIFNIKLY